MGRTYSTYWEMINSYIIFVGNPEGKTLLGRSRSIWVDNIKIDSNYIGYNGAEGIHLPQDRGQ